jgi:hypothetical protein
LDQGHNSTLEHLAIGPEKTNYSKKRNYLLLRMKHEA